MRYPVIDLEARSAYSYLNEEMSTCSGPPRGRIIHERSSRKIADLSRWFKLKHFQLPTQSSGGCFAFSCGQSRRRKTQKIRHLPENHLLEVAKKVFNLNSSISHAFGRKPQLNSSNALRIAQTTHQ